MTIKVLLKISSDLLAFEKVAIYLSNLVDNPDIVEFSKFTSILESQLQEEGVEPETVIKSARKNLKRKLEREFAGINFVHSGRQCFVYLDTLEISEEVKQLLATNKELGVLKAL